MSESRRVERYEQGHAYALNLRQKPSGEWFIDFRDREGKRHRPHTGTKDLAEALAMARKLPVLDMERAAVQEPATEQRNDPRIGEVARYYVETWMPNRDRKKRSIDAAAAALLEFEGFCRTLHAGRVSQVNVETMERYKAFLRDRGNGAKTIEIKVGVVRACWNAALASGLMSASSVGRWDTPRPEDREIRSLEPDQLREVLDLIEAGAPHIAPIARWLAATGNRPSDARDLRWPQVDLLTRTVRRSQQKTRRLAEYQIGPQALAVLEGLKDAPKRADGLVFTINAEPIHRNYLLRWFSDVLEGTDYDWVRPYTLRHTFGYIMANLAGCPLPVLQVLMGHTSIEMTMRYVRATSAQPALEAFAALVETTENPGTVGHHSKSARKSPKKQT